jgi:hypothetical protein
MKFRPESNLCFLSATAPFEPQLHFGIDLLSLVSMCVCPCTASPPCRLIVLCPGNRPRAKHPLALYFESLFLRWLNNSWIDQTVDKFVPLILCNGRPPKRHIILCPDLKVNINIIAGTITLALLRWHGCQSFLE